MILLVLVVGFWSTHLSTPNQEASALERPVTLVVANATSADALASLVAQAGIPGGIISVYDQCKQPRRHRFSLHTATLQRGLDYVAGIDSSRIWVYRDGVILVGFKLADRTILRTVIGDLDIYPDDALSLSTQRFLEAAEVREQVKRAGLTQMSPELGFSSIRKKGQTPPDQPPALQPKHLHNTTLEDALNALASIRGTGVWHYEQFACGNKSSFRISWMVCSN